MSSGKRPRTSRTSASNKRARTGDDNPLNALASIATSLDETLTPFGQALLSASLARRPVIVTPTRITPVSTTPFATALRYDVPPMQLPTLSRSPTAPVSTTTSTTVQAPVSTTTSTTSTTVQAPVSTTTSTTSTTVQAPVSTTTSITSTTVQAPVSTTTSITSTTVTQAPASTTTSTSTTVTQAPVSTTTSTTVQAPVSTTSTTTVQAPASMTVLDVPKVTQVRELPSPNPDFGNKLLSPEQTITIREVINSRHFGNQYFKRDYRNNRATTSLAAGMLIVVEQPDGVENMIIVSMQSNPLIIQVYNITKNAMQIFHPAPNMYVRTFRKTYATVSFFGRNVSVGMNVMAITPYMMKLVRMDQCHGVVNEIFSYSGINMIFVTITTPNGTYIWLQQYMQNFVDMTGVNDPNYMLRNMLSVTLGTRVQNARDEVGIVIMILYQESYNVPHYIIATLDKRVIFSFFHERVLPTDLNNTTRINALRYLCSLNPSPPECFLYNKVALRKVDSWNKMDIVALERGHNHYLNCLQSDDPRYAIRGFLLLNPKIPIKWRSYGFVPRPRERKEITCCRTGKTTMTDYED